MGDGSKYSEIDKALGGLYKMERSLGCPRNFFIAIDEQTNEYVSIEIITNFFDYRYERGKILRELQICSALNHENITSLINLKYNPDFDNFNWIIIVYETFCTNLYQVIHSQQNFTLDHRKFFLYQILRS